MQKTPTATVSAGPVAPRIVGPDKDMRDTYIISGLVLFLAAVVAGFWYYSQTDEAAHSNPSTEALNGTQVSQALKTSTDTTPVTAPVPTTRVDAIPLAARSLDILHDDIQFEIGRKGLTDDAKAALQRHAEFLKGEPDWGVLLQGYTDQQGSMSFNKILGMKRADTVKQQLIALGVPESSIRTVSLGEEGALCIDNSDVCRRMNRRVHVEMRRVGREHLMIPAAAAVETATDPLEADSDPSIEAGAIGASGESFLPSPSDQPETTTEPTSDN
ncbi:MAG: peptidoglycan associated lipoprotein [Nitrospira sp.]|nr:MAG: peptidoglycan associated lipoprotein [Nitrospira sp.]